MASSVQFAPALPHQEEQVFLEPRERREVIVRVIRSARQRLVLSLFRCNDFRILNELAAAVERGVRVDALITPRARGWRKKLKDLGDLLESMGVQVHDYRRRGVKYHAKYMVADSTLALVASLNFTRKCFSDTCDFVFTTSDGGVVRGLQSVFEADCSPSHASFSECISGRLIVGPERARSGVAELLLEARHSICVIDHRISDPWMVDLLKSRETEGVAVATLERRALGDLLSHGKLILIDDDAALIGSMALSRPSLDLRRELAIVIRDRQCVRKLSGLFRKLSNLMSPGMERAS